MRPPVSPLSTTTTPSMVDKGICKDALDSEQTCIVFGLGFWVVWLIFCLSFFVFVLFLRMAIRRKYGIREECCT